MVIVIVVGVLGKLMFVEGGLKGEEKWGMEEGEGLGENGVREGEGLC